MIPTCADVIGLELPCVELGLGGAEGGYEVLHGGEGSEVCRSRGEC